MLTSSPHLPPILPIFTYFRFPNSRPYTLNQPVSEEYPGDANVSVRDLTWLATQPWELDDDGVKRFGVLGV